jgi:hypothetical protein
MTELAAQPVPLPRPRCQPIDAGPDTLDKAYFPLPVPQTAAAPRSDAWFAGAMGLAAVLMAGTIFWAFSAAPSNGIAPMVGDEGRAAATSPAPAAAPAFAAPESMYVPPADGLVAYDPAAEAAVAPAPVFAAAGPAVKLPPAPPQAAATRTAEPPAPQTAAFRPAQRLRPLPNFLAWGKPAQAASEAGARGAAAEAQPSAHVAAPMAALLAKVAERCDNCRGAMPADRLPDSSMLNGRERQAIPSGLLTFVGQCDGQFLYSITNRTGRAVSFELRDATTGEGWAVDHLQPGEVRKIRSSVRLKLP